MEDGSTTKTERMLARPQALSRHLHGARCAVPSAQRSVRSARPGRVRPSSHSIHGGLDGQSRDTGDPGDAKRKHLLRPANAYQARWPPAQTQTQTQTQTQAQTQMQTQMQAQDGTQLVGRALR